MQRRRTSSSSRPRWGGSRTFCRTSRRAALSARFSSKGWCATRCLRRTTNSRRRFPTAGASIASPSTLMALLTTIRAVLRDVRMREQAHEIQRTVGLLLEDVRRLSERVGKLQTHHEQAGKDLQDIVKSTDQIQRRGERIKE